MIRVLSLGAGVQSTTLALMAAAGEFSAPLDAAIFADTQAEPAAVYQHLAWLETVLPNLREEIIGAMRGERRMDARPPFFTKGGGVLRRQCTQDYKVRPIHRKIRELAGIRPKSRGPKHVAVEQWIGISLDEATRMRDSQFRWLAHCYPLVDRRLTRRDCIAWLTANGFPTPPKSACTFCPYHDNRLWRDMKANDPESFADAVRLDEAIRPGMAGPKRPEGTSWYVHPARIPLVEVDFSTAEDRGQINLFENECEGMCGV